MGKGKGKLSWGKGGDSVEFRQCGDVSVWGGERNGTHNIAQVEGKGESNPVCVPCDKKKAEGGSKEGRNLLL